MILFSDQRFAELHGKTAATRVTSTPRSGPHACRKHLRGCGSRNLWAPQAIKWLRWSKDGIILRPNAALPQLQGKTAATNCMANPPHYSGRLGDFLKRAGLWLPGELVHTQLQSSGIVKFVLKNRDCPQYRLLKGFGSLYPHSIPLFRGAKKIRLLVLWSKVNSIGTVPTFEHTFGDSRGCAGILGCGGEKLRYAYSTTHRIPAGEG